jgi:hypothetical protein
MQDFGWDLTYNDDQATLWFGIGPQLDGLGHMGEAGLYYNCNKAVDFVDISGLKKLGTDKVPPLVGRGVLIDMARHFKVSSMVAGQAISAAGIKAAATAQGIDFRQGMSSCSTPVGPMPCSRPSPRPGRPRNPA